MGELYNPYPRLPKNIRQTGDRDPIVKVYMEDYVNTYLKQLRPGIGQEVRVGLLLGNMEIHDGTPYLFLDGALEMEDVEVEGDQVTFSDTSWKKAYEAMEEMFPKRTVQGWFLCGHPEVPLSPINYSHPHNQYFTGKCQLMYLSCGLEGEEAFYINSEEGFYKLRGHCIYYERNQMMQDYMVMRRDAQRVDTGVQDGVIRDFKDRMADRKVAIQHQRSQLTVLKGFCTVLSIIVLAGGIVMINNYNRMREMESVLASVLPMDGAAELRHLPGEVSPTEGESYQAQQIARNEADGRVQAGQAQADGSGQAAAGMDVPQPEAAQGKAETAALDGADGQASDQGEAVEPNQVDSGAQMQPQGQGGQPASADGQAADGAAAGQEAPQPDDQQPASAQPGGGAQPAAEGQPEIPAQAKSWKSHQVQPGETLYGICFERYGGIENLQQIIEVNQLEDQDNIIAGQNLLLP